MGRNPRGGSRFSRWVSSGARSLRSTDGFRAIARLTFGCRGRIRQIRDFRQRLRGRTCPRGEREGRADVFRALRVRRSVAAGTYGRRATSGNVRWNGLVHAESENNMPTARAFARLPFGYCGRIRQICDFRQRLRGRACPRGEREGHADVFRALRVCRSGAAGVYGRRATSGNVRWNGLVHAESENNMPTARAFARLPFGYCGRIRQICDFRQRLRGRACPRGEREGHADVFRALRVLRSVAAGVYGRRVTSGNARWNGLVHAESENNTPTARALARLPFGCRGRIRQIRDFWQRLCGQTCPRGEREGRADVFRALRVLRSVAAGAYGRRATSGNARWNGIVYAESENNTPTARAFARLPFGYCGRAGMSFAN